MKQGYSEIIRKLGPKRVKRNGPLGFHTTFKIGGPADLFYRAESVDELVKVVKLARRFSIPYFILGGGSNILVSDNGFRGLVIKNQSSEIKLVGKTKILVDSGVLNSQLVKFAAENGLTGVEFLIGIPGTVGGAIRHNARFRDPRSFHEYFVDFNLVKDRFMGDLVEKVTILKSDNKITEVGKDYCEFNYSGSGLRSSFKKKEDIILKVLLRLEKADKKAIREVIKKFTRWRKIRSGEKGERQAPDLVTGSITTQPTGKTAGCIFSNLPNKWNHPTGRMIDMCGLRGKKIGGAQISPLHANFIVNLGKAKASEVMELIGLVKKEVKKKFGVELKEEICLVGFDRIEAQ